MLCVQGRSISVPYHSWLSNLGSSLVARSSFCWSIYLRGKVNLSCSTIFRLPLKFIVWTELIGLVERNSSVLRSLDKQQTLKLFCSIRTKHKRGFQLIIFVKSDLEINKQLRIIIITETLILFIWLDINYEEWRFGETSTAFCQKTLKNNFHSYEYFESSNG